MRGCTRAVAAFAVLVLSVAGCSSSGGGSQRPTPSASAPASTAMSAPPLTAADVGAIKHAYETFFDGSTSVAVSQTLLQNGARLHASLVAQAKSPQAKSLSAKVTKVARAPGNANPAVAQATFTLLANGKPLLPGTSGYAVKVNSTWLVSAGTFCQLLQLQNSAPPQCHDSAFTAFPTG
jgi:hypothetical protein